MWILRDCFKNYFVQNEIHQETFKHIFIALTMKNGMFYKFIFLYHINFY